MRRYFFQINPLNCRPSFLFSFTCFWCHGLFVFFRALVSFRCHQRTLQWVSCYSHGSPTWLRSLVRLMLFSSRHEGSKLLLLCCCFGWSPEWPYLSHEIMEQLVYLKARHGCARLLELHKVFVQGLELGFNTLTDWASTIVGRKASWRKIHWGISTKVARSRRFHIFCFWIEHCII